MRYKQGKGDKLFLNQESIKPSVIMRYVGNRFLVLCHLAGILYVLRDKLMLYLENVCNITTSLRTVLIQGLNYTAWASPAFLEGGAQDRARGRHLTAAYTLSAFGRFNQ